MRLKVGSKGCVRVCKQERLFYSKFWPASRMCACTVVNVRMDGAMRESRLGIGDVVLWDPKNEWE